ncbi:MAG: hypothetical protein PVI90_07130 [Desulfobacteraceae bacterium]|jgi:hypothetical protein
MGDLRQFAVRMKLRGKRLGTEVNRIVRQVALQIDQAVVLATPVNTGFARSNWIVSLDVPVDHTHDPFSPIKKGMDPNKINESANAKGAIDQGKQVIATRKLEQDVYITNNTSYIGKLNDGSSAQAPAQFVETAIEVGSRTIRNAKVSTGP